MVVNSHNNECTPMVMLVDCNEKEGARLETLERESGDGNDCSDSTRKNNGSSPRALFHKSTVVSLVDPSCGEERQYIRVPASDGSKRCDLLEIQRLKMSPYGSYFVGSRIVSDGALYVSTKVDPLFFVLHALTSKKEESSSLSSPEPKTVSRWQPLEQLLVDIPQAVQDAMLGQESQLQHLCETTDDFGDDLVLYKFSSDRTLQWLKMKQLRAFKTIQQQMLDSKKLKQEQQEALRDKGGSGAFSSTFRLAQEEHDDSGAKLPLNSNDASQTITIAPPATKNCTTRLSQSEEKEALEASVQVVSEYLSQDWRDKLVQACSMTKEVVMSLSEKNQQENKKPTSSSPSWEGPPGAKEADQLLNFTMGGAVNDKDDSGSSKTTSSTKATNGKKISTSAQTIGLKRLAKVNTKGMKSLASFFGGSQPKKAKKLCN